MFRIKNPLHARVGKHIRRLASKRWVRWGLVGVVSFFVLANVVTFAIYRNRLYPNSGVGGLQLGNKTYDYIGSQDLITNAVLVRGPGNQFLMSTAELGIQANWPATQASIQKRKPWLPIIGYFGHKEYDVQLTYNDAQFKKALAKINDSFSKNPTDWSIDTSSGEAILVKGKPGYRVEAAKIKSKLNRTISIGLLEVPLQTIPPKVTDKQLQPLVNQLQAKQQVSLSYSYNGTIRTPSSKDILSWYDISASGIALNKDRVSSYISGLGSGLGIRVQNLAQLTNDTLTALDKQSKLSAAITAAPKATKHYTFCVRAKNVPDSELAGFAAKLSSTLNDSRGWSLDGRVSFSQASSGCNMMAWLSAASSMASFGTICDSLWSCTVYPNVIINYDRWRYASDAWNAANGTLDDYRSMVINHESGHWLGFGHRYCGGAGQQAPVMQQQSISLQGCVFNPWPTSAEKDTLKAKLGL